MILQNSINFQGSNFDVMRKIKCFAYELNFLAVLFALCFTFTGSRKTINMEREREGRKKGNRISQLFTAYKKNGFYRMTCLATFNLNSGTVALAYEGKKIIGFTGYKSCPLIEFSANLQLVNISHPPA